LPSIAHHKEIEMNSMFRVFLGAALISAALTAPTWAKTTGQQAVDLCRKTHNCVVDIGPRGDVLILGPAGGTVTCKSLSAPCTAHARIKPKSGLTVQADPVRSAILD